MLTGCAAAQAGAAGRTEAPTAALSVTTLGTAGGPPPHVGRAQPATLLQVGGRNYLIDVGEGAAYQLRQANIRPGALHGVFITHLHWDHALGLDYLMATDWMSGRTEPLPVYGPPGLDTFMSSLLATVGVGESIFRAQAPGRPSLASLYPSHEVDGCQPLEVFKDDAVSVRSVCNSHFAEVRAAAHPWGEDRSLSYRFDTAFGSVTFTGDTGPSTELENLARGSDILVAEVVHLPSIERALRATMPNRDLTPLLTHMAHQHLTPEALGGLATRAEVETLVVTHFVMGQDFDPTEFESLIRPYFSGDIVIGEDLATVTLR